MNPTAARLKILVCHGTPLLDAGIAALLQGHGDLIVMHGDGDEAVPWRHAAVDVVVTDYARGLQCAELPDPPIRGHAQPRVVVVTDQASQTEIHHAVACGIHGYLLLDCSGPALARAVRLVARGVRCFDETVSGRMADGLASVALTQREHEVLRLLASGCGNKAIAQRMDIAVGTVKVHIRGILHKLGVRSRMQAAAVASERGLLRVPPGGPRRPVPRWRPEAHGAPSPAA